jgi:uncharacterized membrane protein
MKPFKRIVGINLLGMFAYSALIRLVNFREKDHAMDILIMSAFAVGLHVLICGVVSGAFYARNKNELGKAWILSTGIVLLIGFSTCLGNASL